MKNIHVLPTSQPSNLLLCIKSYIEHKDTPAENSDNKGNFRLGFGIYANKVFYQPHHIYITSDEEIKEGDWVRLFEKHIDKEWIHKITKEDLLLYSDFNNEGSKIILTTDQDLITDDVQAIDDEFLEWFIRNSSCEYVEVVTEQYTQNYHKDIWYNRYKIIIPKEEQKQHLIDMMKSDEEFGLYDEPKQETLEEAAERHRYGNTYNNFIRGAKWQQEKMFDVMQQYAAFCVKCDREKLPLLFAKEWFEQLKKK